MSFEEAAGCGVLPVRVRDRGLARCTDSLVVKGASALETNGTAEDTRVKSVQSSMIRISDAW